MAINFELNCLEIANILQSRFEGNPDKIISGFNNIEFATDGQITFISDEKYLQFLNTTKASCIIISDKLNLTAYKGTNFIIAENPHRKFGELLMYISMKFKRSEYSIHPNLVIDETSQINRKAVTISANVVIGKNCRIGNNVVIHSNVSIYDNVEIGDGTVIHSSAVICDDTIIGRNCNILPGAVIGSDGFGFSDNPDGSYSRIPQMGNVVIEDDVEIGANTTIDRALVGSTIIRKGTKLDNLIQIAHNVRIGENTAMAAQSGIAGSTHIGARNKIGGQVGIIGHIHTTDDVVIMAQSGVDKSLDKKGLYFGSPAKERLQAFRTMALINRLPEIIEELKKTRE